MDRGGCKTSLPRFCGGNTLATARVDMGKAKSEDAEEAVYVYVQEGKEDTEENSTS